METKIHSRDLFESAYLITRGCSLEKVQVASQEKGKPVVTFLIVGKDAESEHKKFRFGSAEVNITNFRTALNRLKDLMFEEIRSVKDHHRKEWA